MAACRAIGLDWSITHAVLNTLPGIGEDCEEKLSEMEEQYVRLSVASAERLLNYW